MPNIVEELVNDICGYVGIHEPKEFIHFPADAVRTMGFPTIKEAFPSPREIGDRLLTKVPTLPIPRPREFIGRFPL